MGIKNYSSQGIRQVSSGNSLIDRQFTCKNARRELILYNGRLKQLISSTPFISYKTRVLKHEFLSFPVVSLFLSLSQTDRYSFFSLFSLSFLSPLSTCFLPPLYRHMPCSYLYSCLVSSWVFRDIFSPFIGFHPSLILKF